MTAKRWFLLAVPCLGFLAYSGGEAQAQATSDYGETAYDYLAEGYIYAYDA